MSDFNAEDHQLPAERNRHIFRQRIVPDLLEGKTPQKRPTALFLISQPGSGKSRLQKEVERPLLEQGGYVDLDSDLYKPYHDDYDALMQRDDKLMTAATRADGREWMRLASEYARERNLNVIVQDTAQNPEYSAQMMESYRQKGYNVTAELMAVDKTLSDQGINARYFEQVRDRGAGRLTVQDAADRSYQGTQGLAQIIEDKPGLVERARMWRRGENTPCYDTADSRWQGQSLAQTLRHEREGRPWTPETVTGFQQTQERMKSPQKPEVQAKLGPDWQSRMADLDQRAKPKIATAKAAEAVRRANRGGPSAGKPMDLRARAAARKGSPSPPPKDPEIER